MKRARALTTIAIALTVSACQTIDEQPTLLVGQAEILQMDGTYVGRAALYKSAEELTVNIALRGLDAGEIDIALGSQGSCLPQSQNGALLAALPSAAVGASGSVTVSAWLPGPPEQLQIQLLDGEGSTVAITQAGENNALLACGVFKAN